MNYQSYKEAHIAVHGAGSFHTRPNMLNLFGIRSKNLVGGEFDDLLGVAFINEKGQEEIRVFPGTTDPGLYYLQNPINVKGTGILAPGFYPDLWCKGLHKGYSALIQCGIAKAYRDTDRDNQLDFTNLQTVPASTRCDWHYAWKDNKARKNTNFSAMCQVPQDYKDFVETMILRDKQIEIAKYPKFNYTLWFDLQTT